LASLVPLLGAGACAHYTDVKELKTIAFDQDVSKGKSTGQFEADDCVYQLFGYWMGGYPDVSRAIANARTQKKSQVTDVAMESKGGTALRYINNVDTKYDGFSAGIFGKTCINVRGVGYL
jgi:hypothetical protein